MATSFNLVLPVMGREFSFRIWHRVLDMRPAGQIRYLWFDLRDFRRGGRTFRQSADYWWEMVTQTAPPQDREANELNLVLAELFPTVAASKGCQRLFRDAPLGNKHDKTYTLPHADWTRLLNRARNRDHVGICAELENSMVGDLPTQHLLPAFQRALEQWSIPAIQELRRGGRPALQKLLAAEIVPRIQSYRRRGGLDHVYSFLDALAHESKVAAYACYSAAWRALLAVLYHVPVLDSRSARLNWLLHSQQDNSAGQDVFKGTILSLHPLSSRLMVQSAYRIAIGNWLLACEKTCPDPWSGDYQCPEYWAMMAAIAAAAQEYAVLRDRSNARRARARSA